MVLMVRVPPPLCDSMASTALLTMLKKHLHQLVSIAAYAGKNGFQLEIDFAAGVAKIERTKLHGVGDHGVEIQQGAFCRHLPGETQQVADQCFRAARLIANFPGDCPRIFRKATASSASRSE